MAVGASRDAEVTWNDRRVDAVSLGHSCLEVPNGWVSWAIEHLPPHDGLVFAFRNSAWLVRGSGELVPSKASARVFLSQQTLLKSNRLLAGQWPHLQSPSLPEPTQLCMEAGNNYLPVSCNYKDKPG